MIPYSTFELFKNLRPPIYPILKSLECLAIVLWTREMSYNAYVNADVGENHVQNLFHKSHYIS